MSLSFPRNANTGDIYVAPNGIVYTFDGTKWVGNTNATTYQTSPLVITNSTPSTSSTSGALIVYGGAGFVGDINVGGTIYQNGVAVGTGGGGSSGVSSIIAGTGISVDHSTGTVTITNTGANSTGTNQPFSITDLTNAGSTNTGALTVAGGAGINQDVYVGGSINLSGYILNTSTLNTLLTIAQYNFATPGNTTTALITGGYESTSTTSGDLVVQGGIGVGKSINAGRYITGNTGSFNTIILNGTNLTSLLSGNGVTSITAGTGTAVSTSTGNITVWSTGAAPTVLTRTTASVTVNSVVSSSSVTATIVGYTGYALYSVAVTTGTWVSIYSSTATMTADYSRSISTDPTPGSGVIAEAITTQSGTTLFTPAIIGFSSETVPTTAIPVKIYNNTAATTNITVTLTLLKMEG
jgi:hypothetical protein